MKRFLIAMGALALTITPAFAQADSAKTAPKCEPMKEGKMKCCKKDKDGKMACKMMDHSKMDHSKMKKTEDTAAGKGDQHKDHKPE